MNELLTFPAITFLGVLPIMILLIRIFFKKSITFFITSVFVVSLIVVGNIAFIVGKFGSEYIFLVMPAGVAIFAAIIYTLYKKVKKPLTRITQNLEKLSRGEIFTKNGVENKTINEYSEISSLISKLNLNLENYLKFTSNVKSNKLEEEFHLISENDLLGKALVGMRDNLRVSLLEENKRKEEEYIRNWKNIGINKIVETLRHNNQNLFDLSFDVLSDLISYIGADVGGIFMLEEKEDDRYLELVASYAYDRRKFLKKRVEVKEGLIGACALEKKTIYLSKVPQNYMDITTGLGGGDPRSILLIPLKIDGKLIGVLELAAFKELKKHEIVFIESVSENIASMLLNLKRQKETNFLLAKRVEQEEEMSQQEEQMNLIYEELQLAQDEIDLKEEEEEAKDLEIKELKETIKKLTTVSQTEVED